MSPGQTTLLTLGVILYLAIIDSVTEIISRDTLPGLPRLPSTGPDIL